MIAWIRTITTIVLLLALSSGLSAKGPATVDFVVFYAGVVGEALAIHE